MAKIEMGVGFRVLTYFIALATVVVASFYVGTMFQKKLQLKSNVEVLSIDSNEAQVISKETKKNRIEVEKKIENLEEPIVDDNGYMSDEFMQLLQSAKSNAEQRGNKTGIIYTLTKP